MLPLVTGIVRLKSKPRVLHVVMIEPNNVIIHLINRKIKKAIYLDEIWRLIGVTSNKDVAKFIYKITSKVENENINHYSISHYLTDHYTRWNLTKNDLEKATSGEISEAVFYNSLDYFSSLEIDENEKYY